MVVVESIVNFLRENLALSIGGLVIGFISFIGYLFGDVVLYEYKKWREGDGGDEELEWYKKTASLARQVQRVWTSKYVEPNERNEPYSMDEIKAEMGLLADQLDRHASNITADTAPPIRSSLTGGTTTVC